LQQREFDRTENCSARTNLCSKWQTGQSREGAPALNCSVSSSSHHPGRESRGKSRSSSTGRLCSTALQEGSTTVIIFFAARNFWEENKKIIIKIETFATINNYDTRNTTKTIRKIRKKPHLFKISRLFVHNTGN
jgi:hypothetical protein